jgi:rubrerythrin
MVRYSREEKYSKPKDIQEMLRLAIKRENASIGLYEDMAKHNFSEEMKEFISRLRDEELGHRIKIQSKLNELEKGSKK